MATISASLISIGSALCGEISGQPDEPAAVGVFEVEHGVELPVQVIREIADLLVEDVGSARHDSPRRLPATSTAKSLLQCGHVTRACV